MEAPFVMISGRYVLAFFVGLKYHDGMAVPRQEEFVQHGRINQKQRTRDAIVAAARELLASGVTPTVTEAAEAARVSRTTAYRYFPTQDALLIEIAMNADVVEIEALVASANDRDQARVRALDVLELFNAHVAGAEAQYRTALRLYLDQWLGAAAAGEATPIVRAGRRRRWFEQSLAPLRPVTDERSWEQTVAALCLLCGPEARTVLRDVCRLDEKTANDVIRFAADAILDAGLR
jgi:AcrR family transcriptional regulator